MTTATVTCSRCQQENPALEAPPMPGPMGKLIEDNVCAACWAEWRETSAQLIAHYGLVLGNPQHRKEMRRVMREFLGLDEDEEGASPSGVA